MFHPLKSFAAAAGLGLLGFHSAARADVVLDWNAYLREVMKRDSATSNPGWSTRSLAMMNGAIFDAFQAISRTHHPLRVDTAAPPGTSRHAAAAQAAYRIATALYPDHAVWLSWAGGYSLNLVPNGEGKSAGIALGNAIADAYLGWRMDDGADESVPYAPSDEPGKWRPDPTFFPVQQAWGPAWGTVDPFVLTSSAQFQPAPPPAMNSAEYTAAYDEVVSLGAKASSTRTADQTQIGVFWGYDRSGIGPPPVLYSRNLSEIATQRANTEEQNARLFALASLAMADAAISAWDVKFIHNVWRPITAIREAHTDGNPATTAIADWVPLGAPGDEIFPSFTPPFPAYVSGHASMGQAAFAVMQAFYGTDAMTFTLTSAELPGVVRSYSSLSQAAQENADSRVYLGVHWRFDQTAGQKLGRDVAGYVTDHALTPVRQTFGQFAAMHSLTGQPHSDRDLDGCTDFAEYAFGTNPVLCDTPPAAMGETVSGVPCLVLRYTVDAGRAQAGLTLTAEASEDLTDWTTEGITDEPDPDVTAVSAAILARRAWVPIPGEGQRFLRLRAAQ